MDIPSIKFRYFEKLKLWHDYLSPNSIFETQKKEYWKHEKTFLLWALTPLHRHLYTGINTQRILEIYDESGRNEFGMLKAYVNEDYAKELDELKKDINKDKINYIKGNLCVEGFVESAGTDAEGYPEKIRIAQKGLLLGEIIFESYSKEAKFWNNNFRKYRWGFNLLVGVIVLSALLFLLNQIIDFGGKIFDDTSQKNSMHQKYNDFGKHYYKFQR